LHGLALETFLRLTLADTGTGVPPQLLGRIFDPYFTTKQKGSVLGLAISGGMGGQEAVAHLLAVDPAARVIVSSGYSNDPIIASCRDFGFAAVLARPYRFNQMKETLLAVLQEWGLLLAGMDAGRTPLGCPTEFTWCAAVASSCAREEGNARLPLHSRPPNASAHPTVVGTRRRLQLGRNLREAVSGATAGA